MKQLLFGMAVVAALLVPQLSLASTEGVLVLNDVRVASQGIDNSGPIVVTATKAANGFSSFTVQAFNRTVSLTKAEIAKLRGEFVNGVQLSYEAGYKELGGRTVYIVLSKGFTSGLQETQCISVNERGIVKVENAARKPDA